MAIIVGIKFRNTNKVYYFDPKDLAFEEGDGVIVETARGVEMGTVALANRLVDESGVVQPLKKVVRAATQEDFNKVEENKKKEDEFEDEQKS